MKKVYNKITVDYTAIPEKFMNGDVWNLFCQALNAPDFDSYCDFIEKNWVNEFNKFTQHVVITRIF